MNCCARADKIADVFTDGRAKRNRGSFCLVWPSMKRVVRNCIAGVWHQRGYTCFIDLRGLSISPRQAARHRPVVLTLIDTPGSALAGAVHTYSHCGVVQMMQRAS